MPLVHVRPAIPEDAPMLCAGTIRSIREICGRDPIYTSAELDRWCSNKTPENFRAWMAEDGSHMVTGLLDGAIAGVGFVNLTAGTIYLVYIVPEALGTGLGAALVQALEGAAREAGLTCLALESTPFAQGFYERQGFKNLGPTERVPVAYAMAKDLV